MRTWKLASLLAGTVLAPAVGAACAQASLFLDSWGVDYDAWAPASFTGGTCNYVVEDWKPGSDLGGWLDPGWASDAYDAEAAYVAMDGDFLYVAVVTGFPLEGLTERFTHYDPGDLALDLDCDGEYDFAVDVSDGGVLRSGDLVWENPSRNGGPVFGGVSDPLRVTSWNQSAATQFSYASWEGRYAIEAMIDLDDLGGPVSEACLHWTMSCGRDAVDCPFRAAEPVPEPASLLLLGTGLGLAGLLHRRRTRAT